MVIIFNAVQKILEERDEEQIQQQSKRDYCKRSERQEEILYSC